MRTFSIMSVLPLALLILPEISRAQSPQEIVYNIETNDKQSVLAGHIESFAIARGNARFFLGPGELTLFDFGSGRIAAMAFKGDGRFFYTPPNEVEHQQLVKFTGSDVIVDSLKEACFLFTVELDSLPDTAHFARAIVDGDAWKLLKSARHEQFDHLSMNLTNRVLGDLLTAGPGTYFNAYLELEKNGQFVFEEDPINHDFFGLCHLTKYSTTEFADVVNAYSPDNDLPSQRGVAPIDITHYDLQSRVEGDGDMLVKCRIRFTPMRWGQRFVYLYWFGGNRLVYAIDSAGDSLFTVRRTEKEGLFTYAANEPGLGLVLNKPLELGRNDSIEICFQCKSIENLTGNYQIRGRTSWYPQNAIRDVATYNMVYNCPKSLDIIGCGNLVESSVVEGRHVTRWVLEKPVEYVSFSFGSFESKTFAVENYQPTKIFMSETIPHSELALFLAYFGELSSANMIGRVGADVANSLIFYSSLFGPCPFDTVRAVEFFSVGEGQGSPGLIHLSWDTFQQDDVGGRDEMFRAHEVAHQWWGHLIDYESYRDTWLTEGLSEYCGFWFYQMSSKKTKVCNDILAKWQKNIISGVGVNSKGGKAGPVVLGYRLFSSKSNDYGVIVYQKGAYIFHMIRYLMHDYDKNSDDAFADLLKDMVTKFRGKVITTEKFRALLEEHMDSDMGWFFDQYVYGTDIPEYKFSSAWQETGDGKYKVTCHIRQQKVPETFQMTVPLTILFKDDKYLHLKIWVDQPEMDVDLPLLPYKPERIIFNTYDAVLCKVKYE